MQFKDVPGQETLKSHLIQGVKNGRVSHAQLFCGPEGSGGLALALAYAQYINCENPGDTDSCGVCANCNKYSKLIHPDLHFCYPVSGKEKISTAYLDEWRRVFLENPYLNIYQWIETIAAENKQGNITADEAREIIRKLTLKMFEGPYKVLIMWMPEYLKEEGNILLKLIEEPPENTLLLFVAEDAEKIIGTIQSRTQRVQLLPLNEADVMQGLMQKYGLGEEQAREIARVADGNFNAAIELMAETENNYHELFRDWMLACKANQMRTMIEKVDEIADMGRLKQKNLLGYALYVFRSCMLYNHGVYDKLISNTADQAFISKFSRFVTEKNIDDFASKFNDAIFHIERNANPKITLLNISLQVEQLFKAA